MTDFTQAVLAWCHHAEAHGLYSVEYREDFQETYIGAWDADRSISLVMMCAPDFEQRGETYFEAASLLADRLSRQQVWDEQFQEYVSYPHLPVLVVPAGIDLPGTEDWDGLLWVFDGTGIIGIDR